jgi:hypothetical protein
LNYIGNYNTSVEAYWLNEKSAVFDGPLFDLPGGTVKAAIGASYISNKYIVKNTLQSPNNTIVNPQIDSQGRNVWATFAQLNIPVFRFGFEASLARPVQRFRRHSNQKIGIN